MVRQESKRNTSSLLQIQQKLKNTKKITKYKNAKKNTKYQKYQKNVLKHIDLNCMYYYYVHVPSLLAGGGGKGLGGPCSNKFLSSFSVLISRSTSRHGQA